MICPSSVVGVQPRVQRLAWEPPTAHPRRVVGRARAGSISPLMRRSEVPEAFVPYSSPWWLLDALCGAGDDAQIVGDEDVRGIATTHIRMTVDSARAVACSPSGLRLPLTRADAFAAEVWLDGDGRLRRMAARGQRVAGSDSARASPIESPPSCGTSVPR